MFNRSLTYGASAAAILMATSGAAFAQETTGGIRGVISDAAGAPVANATVVITHVPSGTNNTIVTSADGAYYARNLRIGGPYTVAVSSAQGDVQGNLASVNIGTPGVLNLTVSSGASEDAYSVADIVVRGARSGGLQTGPRTRVNAEQIETLPSISRDIKDFARTSPFASIDPTNNDAIILGGQNNRMNAFMVDGTRQGDDFGLASNGYPTVNSPISISVLQAVQVDVAPYDVQYGNFQGGVINSVTKSGGNEFHGELFYETTNDSMQGDEFTVKGMNTGVVKTQPVSGDFEETTWGATLSGPIIKDRLFFLANYEKFEATRPVLTGPTGSGATNEVPFVTQDDVDTVRDITKSIYGYDPLDWSADEMTTFDEKYFLKLDWNINDAHRAVVSYQQTEGSILSLNGTSTSNTTPAVGLLSQGYQLQTNLVSYKAQVFSDWTENFSTELAYTRKETENISSNLAGSDFAAMRVMLPTQGAATPSIYLGPERSRHMNMLTNDLDQFRVIGKYTSGANRLTFGYERENLEIYNAFVQAANAEYEFASVADFEAGRASYINYQNAASNDKIDGGASFSYASNVLFFQNEFDVNDKLTLRGGLRYEWYDMDDEPMLNEAFGDKYGFRNNYTLDGISLLQPRVGFNYRVDDTFNIYGGFGLFMGGSPNVWVSNNFSNPGNLIGQFQCRRDGYTSNNVRSTVRVCSPEELAALAVTDGTNPAQIAKDKVTESANLGTGVINVIDPKFEMPSIWKFSIGATKDFDLSRWNMGEGWNVRTEYVRSEVENAVGWKDLNMEQRQSGTAPDGRPLYSGPNGSQVVLMLTNFKEGFTDQFTVGVNKNWYEGWAEGLGFDLSYTYVDSNDVHPGTSSVAASNYGQMAVFDPNNPELATSNYEIQHSTKLNLSYRRAFFGDYRTSFNLFGERRSGLPYSHTINGANNGEANEYSRRNRMLLYVPTADASGLVTATSDSRVTYAANFDFAGFNEYLQKSGLMKYAGQAAPRNSSKSPDVTKFDLRIAQELPAFFPNGARLEAYLDVENLGNLLNDEWGVVQQTNFPSFYSPVTGTMSSSSFNYTKFEQQDPRGFNNQSVWQVKVGVRYKF